MTSISAIIVNYQSAKLVVEALPSLVDAIRKFPKSSICIVDNKSPGNDVFVLSKVISENNWDDFVYLKVNEGNYGFADGNNLGLRTIKSLDGNPEFIYLINPDAKVSSGALSKMVSFLACHATVGIVGSRLESPDGSLQISAFNFPTVTGEFIGSLGLSFLSRLFDRSMVAPPQKELTFRTDWVSGASLMIRSRVLESVEEFDAGYFLYFEETDFMFSAACAGWETWYLYEAQVQHLGGQSTGVHNGRSRDGTIPLYWFDSWRRYYVKNHGRGYAILAMLARLSGMILNRGHRLLRGKRVNTPRYAIRHTVQYGLWPLLFFGDPLGHLYSTNELD